MKVFASLFSKSDWGSGQRPEKTPFLVLFAAILPKRTEAIFSHKRKRELPIKVTPLFFYVE
ncbi:MAG: hypothetical protein IKB28_03855 [Clostridia bacterium]|nr:hypothetical protein [Clostridia bacterium]